VVAASRGTANLDLDRLDGVTPVEVDLALSDAPAGLIRRTIDEQGRVDVLVNNVGVVHTRIDGFLGTDDDEFEWAMQTRTRRSPSAFRDRAHRREARQEHPRHARPAPSPDDHRRSPGCRLTVGPRGQPSHGHTPIVAPAMLRRRWREVQTYALRAVGILRPYTSSNPR
jgi:NAD(P)-dependent dehydrogenase (short-subunit alcohol dehydrogenase family)